MAAYQASFFVLFSTLTEVYSRVTDSIFMTMSSKCPESQRVKRKEKDKTPLFCCCNFQWPLPATVISPEHVLMVSLVAFCCGVLTCFPPFENIWCEGSKQMGGGWRGTKIQEKEKYEIAPEAHFQNKQTNKPQVFLMAVVDGLKERGPCLLQVFCR